VEIHAREILALRARVDEIYAKHTSQSVERVHADMERDRYFTGEEGQAYGLVDRVLEQRELASPGEGLRTRLRAAAAGLRGSRAAPGARNRGADAPGARSAGAGGALGAAWHPAGAALSARPGAGSRGARVAPIGALPADGEDDQRDDDRPDGDDGQQHVHRTSARISRLINCF
jgi:hypothetical protein